jgi:hypothetical protein
MNKKILLFLVFFAFLAFPSFSGTGFEVGLGSGYIFYGNDNAKSAVNSSNQVILSTDAAFFLTMNDFIFFSLGGDAFFDFRWGSGEHIYLIDYAFLAGIRVYPNLWGLFISMDYALGRRTDFISTEKYDGRESTSWGNGFKFSLGYDFSAHMKSFAPELVVSLKSMPRGGSRDNLLGVSLRLTRHK